MNDLAGNPGTSSIYPIDVDTTPPTTPTLFTADRPVWGWKRNPTIGITWTGMVDSGSGIAGYNADWSTVSNTIPSTVMDTLANTLVYTLPSDGTWYFHVRGVDNADNWGVTAHAGPYLLDSTPPDAPVIAYSDPVTGEWTSDNVIDVYWNIPAAAARVVGWSYDWSTSSATVPDTTQDSPELVSATQFKAASPVLLNSNNHYFHIRALDMAETGDPLRTMDPSWWIPRLPF